MGVSVGRAALVGLVAASAGCGGRPRPAPANATKAPAKPVAPLNLATASGSADRRDPATGRRVYTIAWKQAALQLGEEGIREGTMTGVSGTLYRGDRPASTFTADRGYAKKASRTLRLESRVTVRSTTGPATLTAQKLEWLPDVGRVRASGNVVVSDGIGRIEAPALDATPDLRKVATPDAFDLLP